MTRAPQLTARKLIRFLKSKGFTEVRQSGSHLILSHEETNSVVIVPVHGNNDIGRGLVTRILKSAGFTVDDFLNKR